MIDIHTHILPEIDDGAENFNEALQILEEAVAGGTQEIILTPHCAPVYGFYNYNDEDLDEWFEQFCSAVSKQRLPVVLYPGMEVLYEGRKEFLKNQEKFATLCGSRYLLMEYFFNVSEKGFLEGVMTALECGYIPIIAHPERYECVQCDCLTKKKALVLEAMQKGAKFQLNKGSLSGRHGKRAAMAGEELLQMDAVDFIASDAHNPTHRNANLKQVENYIKQCYGNERVKRLFYENPRRVVENKQVQ